MKRDSRIDDYIASRAEFARPMLVHLRARVAQYCPEAEETIKWSSPAWTYRGQLLCSMAAFKQHAAFGFWRGVEVTGGGAGERDAMGQFGRMARMADLPGDAELARLLARAAALIDSGVKAPRAVKHPKPALEIPADFRAALDADPAAAKIFEAFPPSYRRDYLEWIIEAKRAETRARRIAQAVEWIAEGKGRNWKYQNG